MGEIMSFYNTYKRLDKLCRDLLKDERGLSAYIDAMRARTDGNDYVNNWAKDLKALKHYRWVRNQLAHEPDVTEHNFCDTKDEEWLLDFYKRILQQTDPLTLYRRAKRPNQNGKIKVEHIPARSDRSVLWLILALLGSIALLVFFVWLSFYYST